LVGDDSASVILQLLNEQINVLKNEECDIVIENGCVEMFRGKMRLVVGPWSNMTIATERHFFKEIDENNNLSRLEFQFV